MVNSALSFALPALPVASAEGARRRIASPVEYREMRRIGGVSGELEYLIQLLHHNAHALSRVRRWQLRGFGRIGHGGFSGKLTVACRGAEPLDLWRRCGPSRE